jgi:hypothetical protein
METHTEKWDDEVLLHDGRAVEVHRKVAFHYSSSAIESIFTAIPDQYFLEFKHPDTGESINWYGAQDIYPIMLDFVDGTPYLVIYSELVFSNVKLYGCPDIPYVFLKYDEKTSQWIPLKHDQAPKFLRQPNLSFGYNYFHMENGKRQTAEFIRGQYTIHTRAQSWSVSEYIPESNDTWKGYNSYKYKRFKDDCRPPLPLEKEVVLPPPQEVKLEILETKDYTPVRFIRNDEWTNLSYDRNREEYCKSLFRLVDPYNPLMGKRFTKDTTGQKKVPYHNSQVGVLVLCEPENIFYYTKLEPPNKMVITKYTVTGDMLYRISFQKPEELKGFIGAIRKPSLKSENGYLNFEWWYFQRNTSRDGWEVKRTLKVRLHEPKDKK